MKKILPILLIYLAGSLSVSAQFKIVFIKGEIKVRYGMNEQWQDLKSDAILKLEDAISVGKKSSVVIQVSEDKKILIPEQSIIELSDLRRLTKEDLLLKLAMDKILTVPPQQRKYDLMPAPAAVIHGENKNVVNLGDKKTFESAMKILKGARVLYEHNFYGTCALRIKEVFRLYPDVQNEYEYKLIAARSLEKSELYDEALNEYVSISLEKLDPQQRDIVKESINILRKKLGY